MLESWTCRHTELTVFLVGTSQRKLCWNASFTQRLHGPRRQKVILVSEGNIARGEKQGETEAEQGFDALTVEDVIQAQEARR